MKKLLLSGLLLTTLLSAQADELTAERIYSSPSVSGESIRGLKVSPDGERVTFLRGKATDYERLDLWEYNVKDKATRLLFNSDDLHQGDEHLSDEERGRRERMRLTGTGIVDYHWSEDGKALLFPLAGDVYYWRVGDKKARKVVDTKTFETDVKFSPKGRYISFVRDQNLVILDLATGKERAITKDGGGLIKYGMAEFVAQEEMDRLTGYWWSEDDSKIAFIRVDESPVAEVTRTEIYAEDVKFVKQRYPFAGSANAKVDLGIIDLKTGEVKWVDLGENKDFYLPRVRWTKDSNLLSYQWESRDQKALELRLVSWPDMTQRTLIKETSNTWLNLQEDLRFLKDGKHFIWASEDDGYKHLYLYDLTGKRLRQLTKGPWVVDALKHIDEKKGLVYFTGRKDTPLESQLYSVPLAGGPITRISTPGENHAVEFSKSGKSYVDLHSSVKHPPQVSLHNPDGRQLTWLLENKVDQSHPLYPYLSDWIEPEFGTIKNAQGTKLYYRLYKPKGWSPDKKFPALVYLYGGPGVQRVTNSWGDLFPEFMAQQGYAVFTLDNRGSYNRGKAFEEPIYHAMGTVEVEDQIEGVKFLRSLGWIDPAHVGVHGASYGGFMSLMCMFKAPEYFKAGAAGAPVTDWTLYDTHYTERYLGNPKEDPKVYERSSVFDYAKDLKGPLLIYHGMADDNVLFTNSTKLYKLLQDNDIPFFCMDYPGKKHRFSGKETSMHRLNTIRNFFDLQFGIKR